jgi:hypothetical protein
MNTWVWKRCLNFFNDVIWGRTFLPGTSMLPATAHGKDRLPKAFVRHLHKRIKHRSPHYCTMLFKQGTRQPHRFFTAAGNPWQRGNGCSQRMAITANVERPKQIEDGMWMASVYHFVKCCSCSFLHFAVPV